MNRTTWEYLLVDYTYGYVDFTYYSRTEEKKHGIWRKNGAVDKSLTDKPYYEVMNILGREGWELILFETCFYFKRSC